MSLVNQDKPTTTLSNSTKINIGEVWNTNSFTWATETRTWNDMTSLIDNITKISSSLTNIARP